MGDPECQTILPKLNTDLLDIFISCCNETLDETDIKWQNKKSLCIVLCAKGYPDEFKKNILIQNLNQIQNNDDEHCYHAGTKLIKNESYSIGGRVLNFVCLSNNFEECREKIINSINKLNWNNGFYRKDIGHKVIGK